MAVKLNTYINFKDQAQEALEFYESIFGGEVYFDTFEKFASDEMPIGEEDLQKVMHGFLKGDNGIELMLADTPSHMEYNPGIQRISLSLSGDDEALLRGYWDKLVEGGKVNCPLEKAPWGDTFGMLTDKYGIDWMVDIGPIQNA